MTRTKIMVILIGCCSLFFFTHHHSQAQTTSFQEQLNSEIDELFHPSRQKMLRSVVTTPPAMRKCATPLLKRARKYQELLTPENKYILYRPTDSWDRYYYGNVYISSYDSPGGHFRLYYTNDNSNDDAVRDISYVKQFAYYFDLAWEFIINTLDYRPPIEKGEKIEVYIMDIYYYGMASADDEGLYIIVNNDYLWARDNLEEYGDNQNQKNEIGAMKVTSVHEFFHVVQAGYDHWDVSVDDNEDVPVGDVSVYDNMWWEENTAVWIEDELHDKVDDYLGYLGWPYIDYNDDGQWDGGEAYFDILDNKSYWWREKKWFDYPHVSLNKTGWDCDYDAFEYGGVVWAKFLSENFGRAMIKTIFEQFPALEAFPHNHYLYSALDAIKGAIEDVGQEPITFSEAFIQFKLANLLRHGYEEGNNYPVPFHEGSIRDYSYPPPAIVDTLSSLSAKYFAFHKPSSGSQTIRISFEGGNSDMTLLAVPADALDSGNYDPNVPSFSAIQRIPLDSAQNGEYYFSFSDNLSTSKLIIIPINLGWIGSPLYSLQAEQLKESSLPPVPQIVNSFYDPNQKPIVHLGWQPVQDVDQFQIWRGLKGNYQSLIFQSPYEDTNSYEDPNRNVFYPGQIYEDPNSEVFYPGQTYFYQIKFINAAGSSSSEIIRVNIPEYSFCPLYLQAQYEYENMADPAEGPFHVKVSFTIKREKVATHNLQYQIERSIKGADDSPDMVQSKTPIEFPDEDIVDIVYYDSNVLQYREYTYSITVFDEITGVEAKKDVTVNTTDIESLLKIPDPDLAYPQGPEEKDPGWGICFIAAVAP